MEVWTKSKALAATHAGVEWRVGFGSYVVFIFWFYYSLKMDKLTNAGKDSPINELLSKRFMFRNKFCI